VLLQYKREIEIDAHQKDLTSAKGGVT